MATGCAGDAEGGEGSGSGTDGRGKRAAPSGVVSKAQADKLIDHYEKVNNEANKKADPGLLSTVEGGALLEQSKADYKQDKNLSKKELKEGREPFFYVDRKVYIPRDRSADWFLTVARSKSAGDKKSKVPALLVMEKQGGKWKMVASGYSEDNRIPRLAEDKDGFVVPAGKSRKVGEMAPDGLPAAFLELYTSKGSTAATGFRESKTTRWIRKIPKTQNKLLDPYGEAEFSPGETEHEKSYALKTADGGVLAVFNTAVREHDRGTQATATVTPSDAMKAFVGGSPQPSFFVDWLHQSSAYLPKKGKVRLLGSEMQMTDVAAGSTMDGGMPGTDV